PRVGNHDPSSGAPGATLQLSADPGIAGRWRRDAPGGRVPGRVRGPQARADRAPDREPRALQPHDLSRAGPDDDPDDAVAVQLERKAARRPGRAATGDRVRQL